MQILITRPTVAQRRGESARPVAVNEVLDVDDAQARQLIALGKAVAWHETPGAPETATAPAQRKRKTT
jgi:hypothetical protein